MLGGLLFGLTAGILCADLFPRVAFTGLALAAGICMFRRAPRLLIVFACFFCLGFALTVLRFNMLPKPVYGEEITVTVASRRLTKQGDGYCAWQGTIIEPRQLAGATVQVYADTYRPGTYTLSGPLLPPVEYRNPGQGWHYKRKICANEIGILRWPRVIHFAGHVPGVLSRVRASFRDNVQANLGDRDSAALALAIVLGDRSLLPESLGSALYRTGVGHIMALSGLHVSILAGIIMTLLRIAGLPRPWAVALCAVLLILFVIFAGPSPSLLRAVLMYFYGAIAVFAGRERQGLTALLWTAAAMLLFNPLWLFDYAFVYSFWATFICLTLGDRLEKHLGFLPEKVAKIASLSVLIQLTALPLNVYLFGQVALWSPLANIVIIPLLPVLAGLAMLAGLPGPVGAATALPGKLLFKGTAEFFLLLNQFPLVLEVGGLHMLLLAGLSVSVLVWLRTGNRRYLVLCMAGLLAVYSLLCAIDSQVCRAWFLDVGQGDAILIRQQGKWILVDCGDARAGERAVVPTLKFLGVRQIDALIISHPHADHCGGLEALAAAIRVDKVYVNSCFVDSPWHELFPRAEVVRTPRVAGPGITVLPPVAGTAGLNDNSLLVSVRRNGIGILCTGDIEEVGELLHLSHLTPHSILKVPHHGSDSSTSARLLAQTQPRAAVVSCGPANKFGFPKPAVLERLEAHGIDIYRTDTAGCVQAIIWPWSEFTIHTFAGR